MTNTSGLRPTQRSKSNTDRSITIKDRVDGSLHTFNMAVDGTKRVQCKECGAKVGKKQATRHYDLHQTCKSATQGPMQTSISIPQDRDGNDHLEPLAGQRSETPLQAHTESTNARHGDSTTNYSNAPPTVLKSANISMTTTSLIATNCTDHGQDSGLTTQPPDQEVNEQWHPKKPQALLRTYANTQGKTKEESEQQKRHLLQALCGDLTVEMMLTTAKCARLLPYMLHGPSVMTASFMSEGAAEQLRAIIPQSHSLSLYPLCNSNDISNRPTVPDGYEDALNQDHIEVMTQGGTPGMERLIGAIVATGDKQAKIICTEHYMRDKAQDPHAESIKTHHTSLPDDQSTSQYPNVLKIVIIPDRFNNPHFVIGTSAGNYLVTLSKENNQINIGPGRCGAFKV